MTNIYDSLDLKTDQDTKKNDVEITAIKEELFMLSIFSFWSENLVFIFRFSITYPLKFIVPFRSFIVSSEIGKLEKAPSFCSRVRVCQNEIKVLIEFTFD